MKNNLYTPTPPPVGHFNNIGQQVLGEIDGRNVGKTVDGNADQDGVVRHKFFLQLLGAQKNYICIFIKNVFGCDVGRPLVS